MISNELVEGINLMMDGKEEGFNVLYSQTYNYVYKRAKYIMKDEEDALDLTQETFVQAYKGIGSLDNVNNVYAWLGGIAYRQGMKIFNKKKEVLLNEDGEMVFDGLENEETNWMPEESVEVQITKSIVAELIEELPDAQKIAVMGFYFDHKKIEEIAQECECSANTIKSRLNYAKQTLKAKVTEHEMKNRYKLCSVSPVIILMAFRTVLSGENYTISSETAQGIYNASCGRIGLQATALVGTSDIGSAVESFSEAVNSGATSNVSNVGMGTSSSATTGAMSVGGATAKVGMTLGVKLIIAAVATVATVVIGTVAFIGITKDKDTAIPEAQEVIVEEVEEVIEEVVIEEEEVEEVIVEEVASPNIESQLQLIVDSKEMWYQESYSDYASFSYTVSDIDQNGRLEVITFITEGSGAYTSAYYYEVNVEGTELYPVEATYNNLLGTDSEPDLGFDETVYYDATTNSYYYMASDYLSSLTEGNVLMDISVMLKDGMIVEDMIKCNLQEPSTSYDGAWIYYNAQGEVITEAQSEALIATSFAEMEPMTLTMKWHYDDGNSAFLVDMTEEELLLQITSWYEGFSLTAGDTVTTEDTVTTGTESASESDTWIAEASAASGITEAELEAAYEQGKSATGIQLTSMYEMEYIGVHEDKLVIKMETEGNIWPIGDDRNVRETEPGVTVLVYDCPEGIEIGDMACVLDGNSGAMEFVVEGTYDFATLYDLIIEWDNPYVTGTLEIDLDNGEVTGLYNLYSNS